MMRLTSPLFTIQNHEISGRDLILILGGLFLIWKSTQEIWESLEGAEEGEHQLKVSSNYWMVSGQIAIIDIVFSLDSVITAVGMVDDVGVMVTAIVIAVGVMMFAAKGIGEFVDAHPSIKMLALSFLILVGVVLIGEGWEMHIPKGYIYFAMGFSNTGRDAEHPHAEEARKTRGIARAEADNTGIGRLRCVVFGG